MKVSKVLKWALTDYVQKEQEKEKQEKERVCEGGSDYFSVCKGLCVCVKKKQASFGTYEDAKRIYF